MNVPNMMETEIKCRKYEWKKGKPICTCFQNSSATKALDYNVLDFIVKASRTLCRQC